MGGGPSTPPSKKLPLPSNPSSATLKRSSTSNSIKSPPASTPTFIDPSDSPLGSNLNIGIPRETCRLLYAKSNVFVHPTSYLKDNVQGWLGIVERGDPSQHTPTDILLAWIPESLLEQSQQDHEIFISVDFSPTSGSMSENEVVDKDSHLISSSSFLSSSSSLSFSIPISQIYSIQIKPPTLSSWYASMSVFPYPPQPLTVKNSQNQLVKNQQELPTLYFHDDRPASVRDENGKIKVSVSPTMDFLNHLRPHVANLLRSSLDQTIYLVNPNRDDLEVHSVPVFEDGLIDDIIPPSPNGSSRSYRSNGKSKGKSILHESLGPQRSNSFSHSSEPPFSFSLLSNFSKITKNARNLANSAAHQVLSHPLAQPILRQIPPPILNATNVEIRRWSEAVGMGGYDGAKVYLAKWARVVAEEGERARRREMMKEGGFGEKDDEEIGGWEVLRVSWEIEHQSSTRASNQPISRTEFEGSLNDQDGKLLLSEGEFRKRIFQRGLSESDGVRKLVWPGLLGVWNFGWTREEQEEELATKTAEYNRIKSVWAGTSEESKSVRSTDRFIEESHRIEIDCRRTDRTQKIFAEVEEDDAEKENDLVEGWNEGSVGSAHPPSNKHIRKMQEILMTYNYYEQNLGYVQGMSDLLSPIYVVMEGDPVLSFWCFVGLMKRQKPNFLRDQSGMRKQLSLLQSLIALMDPKLHRHLEKTGSLNLFFVFRWILCLFKREFEWNQTQRIWEILWTDRYGKHFHIFFALAIIESQRDVIVRYLTEFDEILKYVNELANTMDPEPLLNSAEVLFLTFREIVATYDKKKQENEERLKAHQIPSNGGLHHRKTASGAIEAKIDGDEEKIDVAIDGFKKLPDFDENLRELLE